MPVKMFNTKYYTFERRNGSVDIVRKSSGVVFSIMEGPLLDFFVDQYLEPALKAEELERRTSLLNKLGANHAG